MYKNGQTERLAKKEDCDSLEIPTLSVDNAGPPDTMYLYYSHAECVTLKG